MKVKIKQEELQSFELSWLCIRPMLHAVRGKDLSIKSEMYNQLNEGQKGIFLFYSYHNHADTLAAFYWFSAYNINELRSWNGIKNGVLYFGDGRMADLLDDIKLFIEKRNKSERPISPGDLELDPALFDEVSRLYDSYNECSKHTIIRMNEWILTNQPDFIEDFI
ncbi:hypothetical protein DFP94_102222 [Fontibacillus phaseoli]|uniref:DUF4375 domain-containing protein n=1 Tax=Fontibacillus phaseoli TaxID=1416533 RepID=A0A369BIQ3_9BACL|nr:hypothetical protein [Fontibacillus phaseoli]RCX21469.1 hypothetical protein DFP94_102222 [Fontibacillus phaseoli]